MKTLNEVFSALSARRRYEVWFVRLGLADGLGAWWFRYLLTNPGRDGCPGRPRGMPVQVWATWFPRQGKPESFIQGSSLQSLDLSETGQSPFHFRVGESGIEENACRGALHVGGHRVSWDLRYCSTFSVTLSSMGPMGFSRTPHSDAVFSGQICLDGQTFVGTPLGFGLQGHNCGYRHRHLWTWAHAYFARPEGSPSTLETLSYEMPLGLLFRRAVLWHKGERHFFRSLRETKRSRDTMQWDFRALSRDELELEALLDGSGMSVHHLPYVKTDCTGDFDVANNSLARATLSLRCSNEPAETLETSLGAVIEMVGG